MYISAYTNFDLAQHSARMLVKCSSIVELVKITIIWLCSIFTFFKHCEPFKLGDMQQRER